MDNEFQLGKDSFNIEKFQKFVLVADIGGENSYFAIIGVLSPDKFKSILKQHIKTAEIYDLPKTLNKILEHAHKLFKISISTAVIAAAGAISRHRHKLKLTSHELEISTEELKKNTMLSTFYIINNFEAEGFGLDFLNKHKVTKISYTEKKSTITTSAILGAGHGLGASITYYDQNKKLSVPIPSEAGHMSLPVDLYFDLEYINYIRDTYFDGKSAPVSSEFAVSGKGVCSIYDFLISKKIYGETILNLKNMDEEEKIKKIFQTTSDIYCKRATELFVTYYAKVARNLALVAQPYSGLYLTGKVAVAAKSVINEYFMKEFLNCSIHRNRLEKIPIYLIDDDELTLFGACNVAVNFADYFNN
jgi:glucokinase